MNFNGCIIFIACSHSHGNKCLDLVILLMHIYTNTWSHISKNDIVSTVRFFEVKLLTIPKSGMFQIWLVLRYECLNVLGVESPTSKVRKQQHNTLYWLANKNGLVMSKGAKISWNLKQDALPFFFLQNTPKVTKPWSTSWWWRGILWI